MVDLTPKELLLVAEMLSIALPVKCYIKTMYRCSFKGFRVDLYSDHTNRQTHKHTNFHKYRYVIFMIESYINIIGLNLAGRCLDGIA